MEKEYKNQETQVEFYDNILLMMLNEKAFSSGLIDEKTKEEIKWALSVSV